MSWMWWRDPQVSGLSEGDLERLRAQLEALRTNARFLDDPRARVQLLARLALVEAEQRRRGQQLQLL